MIKGNRDFINNDFLSSVEIIKLKSFGNLVIVISGTCFWSLTLSITYAWFSKMFFKSDVLKFIASILLFNSLVKL